VKLLVALDLGDRSAAVLEKARQIAATTSAAVWLLHVAEPDPDFVGWEAGPQSVRDGVAESFRKEHQKIQEMADDLRADAVDATALLVQGPTVETILEQASKLGVDMIAMGSHGRSAVHQLLVGSVSEGVLREAKCPVLIVPCR
jgi:nucleotide-binding universal stress UspA family protein